MELDGPEGIEEGCNDVDTEVDGIEVFDVRLYNHHTTDITETDDSMEVEIEPGN